MTKVTQKLEFVSEREENMVSKRKRRKCWLPAFSPFPTMFSKGHFLRVVKNLVYVMLHTNSQGIMGIYLVCGKNARGKIAIGKNVRGKIAIGKNVRAKVAKIP